jgi:hypothetical protein
MRRPGGVQARGLDCLAGLAASQEELGSATVELVAARVRVEEWMTKNSARPLYISRRQATVAGCVASPLLRGRRPLGRQDIAINVAQPAEATQRR